jgi:hypothetical protein
MSVSRYVIARERNVVRVAFRQPPDPPAPKFPGAAAMRKAAHQVVRAFTPSLRLQAA